MTLDVAQILAPVSSGLLAAGAPASDGANSDGGDFAALLTALAGVLGANRLTPAAVSPTATAQVATKSASNPAGNESSSPFLAVADADGLQALSAPIQPDTGGLQLQDPEVEGERDTLAGPEQADSNLAATYPGDARLVLAMAQVLSPTPTQPSPIAREAVAQGAASREPEAPVSLRGEVTAAIVPPVTPGQAGPSLAPGKAPAASPPAPSGIATGARPEEGQARPADKPQVKTTDAQVTLLAGLQAPDILPGAEVPEATGQTTADPRPAGTQGSDSVANSPPEAASSFPALPPGVVRIFGRQMPAEPAPPAQGADSGAAAAAMSADIIAPEETIPTPPMTAKVVAAATSEPSLVAQAAVVSELAALVEPPPTRRQDSASSRSPEARRTLTATATEPGSEAPESPAPAPLVAPSAPSRMPSSTQAPGTAVGDDLAKDSGADLKAMASRAPGPVSYTHLTLPTNREV